MAEFRNVFCLKVMSRILEVSRSGFYDWLRRPQSSRQKGDAFWLKIIQGIFEDSDEVYGSPNIYQVLKQSGHSISKKRVARIMRENGLISCYNAFKKPKTTDSKHDNPISPNLLERNFQASAPDRIWCSDITYIWTAAGWVYLCQVKDLFSRKIVGWKVSYSLKTDFVLDTLYSAVQRRNPPAGLIFHSDRGVQYTSKEFRALLNEYGMISSMSRKGDCWDNAPAESFFATLKRERVHRMSYRNIEEVKKDLFWYIEIFYNQKRLHSSNGYLSPAMFESKNAA